MKKFLLYTLIVFTFCGADYKEKDYQKHFAEEVGGEIEYVLPDKTRVDILGRFFAMEVDWAPKWPEAVGQALYYGIQTYKQPAVLLIVGEGDERFVGRCKQVCSKKGIFLYTIDKETMEHKYIKLSKYIHENYIPHYDDPLEMGEEYPHIIVDGEYLDFIVDGYYYKDSVVRAEIYDVPTLEGNPARMLDTPTKRMNNGALYEYVKGWWQKVENF